MKKVVGIEVVTSDGGTKPLLVTSRADLNAKKRIMDRLGVAERYPAYMGSGGYGLVAPNGCAGEEGYFGAAIECG